MHFRIVLGDFAALQTRPDHESVHGSFDVILAILIAATAAFIADDAHRHGDRLLVDHRRSGADGQRSD